MSTYAPGGLTDAALSVWGKTSETGTGWLPLWRHLADASCVAGLLWQHWLSDTVRRQIAAALPGGEGDGLLLVSWLAGLHDLGKATPAFAWQVPWLADRMRDAGLAFDPRVAKDRKIAPHALAGQLLLQDWLEHQHDWQLATTWTYGIVVGGHHGVPPSDNELVEARQRDYLFGESPWKAVQRELLDWVTDATGVRDRLPEWGNAILPQPVQALLTGIVIVADWIASNQEYFPTTDCADIDRVTSAWEELDLPAPWCPVEPSHDADELIRSRFALPAGVSAYPVQRVVIEQARQMTSPGLMIVEAPMGDGKTEAALAAAEILAARFGASGCFIALPTRATSDAMLSRGLTWLERLPDADTGRGAYAAALAHGKARFNTEYDALLRRGRPTSIGIDEGGTDIAAHRWLTTRKKLILLSDFVIGTIDQLLFMTLKARYAVLRHLGLAGKIVIIDEAHAYDIHMSQFLDRALEWLAAYRVPVIVLSATLPARRRIEMMAAYDSGRRQPQPGRRRRRAQDQIPDTRRPLDGDIGYPVVSVSGADGKPTVTRAGTSGRTVTVQVDKLSDDPTVLADLLATELTDGGCALVVRNTVRRVQETAQLLREKLDPQIPVFVAHSRFLAPDRAAKDRWLLDHFGPPTRAPHRPQRYVVVASQVVEVSLDVDFDLLITDLAPIDLLLQRMGRLHRHQRGRPQRLRKPRCLITGTDWTLTPPRAVAGSRIVYGDAALLRSAAVLWPHLDTDHRPITLPDDIPGLVQTAYAPPLVGPGPWHDQIQEADAVAAKKQRVHKQQADQFRIKPVDQLGAPLLGWLHGHIGDADKGSDDARGRGHVRADSAESLNVILLIRDGDQLYVPNWLARAPKHSISTETTPHPRLARAIAECTIALPRLMTGSIDAIIGELERRNHYPAWLQSPWLAGELILDVDTTGQTQLAGFNIHYDRNDGLSVNKSS